ncbi:MAG TPA: hypothetical protein EYQ74_02100 [Planctomycetes bacterium]|nr:hypothetical protein [Planctomycetota bacterium]
MKRRLTVSLKRDPAITASRVGLGKEKLVYVLVADKRLRYAEGKSRIAYIGTTQNGTSRIASSVAARAPEILAIRGVRSFEARVLTCTPRRNVKTWRVLERALLLAFREEFGEIPWCNLQGKRIRERDEFERYFRRARISGLIHDLS